MRRIGQLAGHLLCAAPTAAAAGSGPNGNITGPGSGGGGSTAVAATDYPLPQLAALGYTNYAGAESPKVIYHKKGYVAYVVINRPQALNACDFDAYRMIRESFQDFDADPNLRVAIFTAVGQRGFCAGSDIKNNYDNEFKKEAAGGPAKTEGLDENATKAGWHIGRVSKPVICGINGHANGGGLEQALASDIRIAVKTAQFGLGEVRLGWLPGGGGTQRLPRMLPKGAALQMLWTGNRINTEKALRVGLIDDVVESHADLLPACEAIAEQIALSAPLAVRKIKEVAYQGLDLTLEEGLVKEGQAQKWLMTTADAREGASAFAQKRAPNWKAA